MASEVGSAYVTLVPSAKGFAAKMQRELGGDIGRAGTASGSTFGEKFSGSAGSSIKSKGKAIFSGLAKGGAVAAAAAGVVVGKVLVDSISAASDLGETLSKAGQIFGQDALPQLEKFAGDAATTMGQSKQQALDAAATFAVFGKSAGLAGKDLVGFSTNFTGLASDLASFNNTTPQEAIDAIGAALRGEAEPMRRYGVLLDDASLRQEALRQGLVKTTKEALTPQQKVLAAQALIYKQTKDAQGDFERTSGGLANQQRILSAQWENAKTSLGKGLLPVVTKLLVWANKMVPKLQQFAGTFKREVMPVVRRVGAFIADLIPDLQRLAQDIAANVAPVISDIVGRIRDFVTAFRDGSGEAGKTKTMIVQAFNDIQEIVRGVVEVIVAIWTSGWGDRLITVLVAFAKIARDVIAAALKVIKGVVNVVMGLLKGDWGRVWKGIKQILGGVWDALKSIVRNGLTIIKTQIANVLAIVAGIFKRGWSLLKTLAINGVEGLIGAVKAIPGKLRDLGGLFAAAGKAIIGQFVDGLKGAGTLISDIAGNVWDAVKGLLNDAIDKINDALDFEISIPGPNVHVNIPDIPGLATGGRVAGATLAVIGEGREPETVLPDSMLRGLLERTAATARMGVAQLTITNWADGTGYLRLLADEAVADETRFRRDLGAMHA